MELSRWFMRAVAIIGDVAERGHSDRVKKRAWFAAGASGYAVDREHPASSTAALRHLNSLPVPPDEADGVDGLVRDLLTLAPSLPWKPSTRVGDEGQEVALVELLDCIDVPLVGAGIMLLGPGASFPEHQHGPEELYLILAGERRWRFGGSDRYLLATPGQVVSNNSNDVHGIQEGDDVMLALWILLADGSHR